MPLTVYQPKDFLDAVGLPHEPQDHHYTGPLEAQTSFGEGGALHHDEGRILFAWACLHGGPVLEIGSDCGVSTRYIHEGLDHSGYPPDHKIAAIDMNHRWNDDDHWPRRLRITHNSYRLLPVDVPLRPAWAFVDADHCYEGASRDFFLALACGVHSVFFHDISPNHPDYQCINGNQSGSSVRPFILDMAKDPAYRVTEILTNCGLGLIEVL